jgi:site-specific recombinase XerD
VAVDLLWAATVGPAVGGVLGHKSAVSTARYAHLAQDRLRDAVAKIGAKKLHPGPMVKAA